MRFPARTGNRSTRQAGKFCRHRGGDCIGETRIVGDQDRLRRLVMFGLVLVAPTFLAGPLRWLAARPTRRIALYLFAGIATAVLLHG